ncbi:MAG: sugar phosphate isomerase/epimerase [Clostridia bacterium]|nr:sugar phosphate isomerase/epimerase [Clostridia bacterium]
MYKQKIGISVGNNYSIPTHELVKKLAQIGFDAVSPVWKENVDIEKIITSARESGLEIASVHAPFGKTAEMWSADKALSEPALQRLLNALEDCKRFDVPVMVVHCWIGFGYTFGETKYGLENFSKLVDKASEYGIKIAFENTEGEEYLFTLMDYFKGNETVGFCWDSGHEMCYNYSKDLLAFFGDRLYMTHLNDNLGISRFDGEINCNDDLHLLPYDGIADWDYNVSRLKSSRPLDILNFELNINSKKGRHDNDIYSQMDIELYFVEAYKRACKIAYRYVNK